MDNLADVLTSMLTKLQGVVITQKLNSTNFTVNKKVFAFTKRGAVVLKLPPDTVKRLVQSEVATLLIMGKRTMKEWVVIEHERPASFKKDLHLFKESVAFVSLIAPISKLKRYRAKNER